MTSFDNALKSDEGNSVYPPDLAKAIFELDIPDRIYLKTAMEFDDKYIVNKGNKWTFDYSGSRRYLVFNQDYISNKLNKYICFKYASTRFQPNFQRCTLIGGISFHIVENMVGFRLVRSDYLSKKRILIMLLFIPCYSD